MIDPFTAMLFITGALGIITIASLVYIASGRSLESRFTVVVSLLLLAALFAFLPCAAARNIQAQLFPYSQGKRILEEQMVPARTGTSATHTSTDASVSVPQENG